MVSSGNRSLGGSICRFATQVASRAPFGGKAMYLAVNGVMKRTGRRFISDTRWGGRISCDTRDFIQRMICNFGLWEPDITAAISDILNDGDVFVDVGANIGYYSLLGASLVGEQGRVFAIEPHPKVFALLQQNIALNGHKNIVPLNLAAGAEEGELELFSGPETSLGESTMVARRGFESIGVVKVKPLTQIIAPEHRSRIALIKIDVEGAEPPILQELMDNIEQYPPGMKILVEMANDQSESEALFERMRSLGFNAYAIPNNYDDDYYLTWTTPIVPTRISQLPSEQMDVIFSRGAWDRGAPAGRRPLETAPKERLR